MKTLYAWYNQVPVGEFTQDADGIKFDYDERYESAISLSLPRTGGWDKDVPLRFLENLLPEGNARTRMARQFDTTTDAFDLLDHADSAGGLCFTYDSEPSWDSPVIKVATPEQIASRIAAQAEATDMWWPERPDISEKFSLAGNQSKFTLTNLNGIWVWPTMNLPSTHILKPDNGAFPHAMLIEAATLDLAESCGLDVPNHGIIEFDGMETYIIERFDRDVDTDGRIRRLRCEDMCQALGIDGGGNGKYDIPLEKMVDVLVKADATKECAYELVSQVVFNTHCGNGDGHAKNHTIILDGDRPHMSPMYDSIVTRAWPDLDQSLGIEIGDEVFPESITPDTWAFEAEKCGLDGDRVKDMAIKICEDLVRYADKRFTGVPQNLRNNALAGIATCTISMGVESLSIDHLKSPEDMYREASAAGCDNWSLETYERFSGLNQNTDR